jgi:hypothetical protein
MVGTLPLMALMLFAESMDTALLLAGLSILVDSIWLGAGAAVVQELTLPRMRAVVSALYLLFLAGIGNGLGPYTVGLVSDRSGDLQLAFLSCIAVAGVLGSFLLLAASRHIVAEQGSLIERARAAGEPV